jgi:glyoxalase family protein
MTILGLHHITLGSSDAQRTIDFYVRVLGLRFVKRTINFDDPGTYHLYFGDETGSPGTAVTFFEWPGAAPGHPGIGGTHHFALTVRDRDGLLQWKRRLTDLGIKVDGPYNRILEIATQGPGFAVDEPADQLGTTLITPSPDFVIRGRDEAQIAAETWAELVPEIVPTMALDQGMHHISAISSDLERTAAFYEGLLGMKRVKMTTNYDDPNSQHWYWSADGSGRPGTLITYFGRDAKKERRAQHGAGQTHHFAFAVQDDAAQLAWREKLVDAGLNVSPVMDRSYFHSIYLRDPDGHIVEIATLNPGFAVDEPVAALGSNLKLPAWLEPQRTRITDILRPITVPEWKKI